MDCLAYTLEGFDLHQPLLGYRLLEGSTFASEVAPRRVNLVVPGVHGEIPAWNDPLSTLLLSLRVEVKGSSPEDREMRWNYLRSLCRLGSNQPVTVRRVVPNRVDSTFAQLQSMTEPVFLSPRHIVQTTMVFHIPSGRWTDVNPVEQELAIPGSDQNVVAAAESTAPITDALVRVQGPVSSIGIIDNTSDTGLTWAGAAPIGVGEYLLVDCGQFTAWRNSDDEWDSQDADESRWLSSQGNGMLSLIPVPSFTVGSAVNSVTVTATGTTGASELHVLSRRTFT